MEITLKNIKHSEFASHETHCFQATVYVDGKRFAIAHNDGFGGNTGFDPIKGADYKAFLKELDRVETYCNSLPGEECDWKDPETGKNFVMEQSLETVVDELLTNWLIEKDAKRLLKRICFLKEDGKLYQLQAKVKPTPLNLDRVESQSWWKSSYTLLNRAPISDTIAYLRSV